MDKLIPLLISWVFIFWLVWYTKSKLSCSYYYPLLVLKVVFGLFSGWLYYFYYGTGDVLHIQQDAAFLVKVTEVSYTDYFLFLFDGGDDYEVILNQIFYEGEPRTLFFVKLISVVNLLSYSNFWLSAIFLSVLGFCATIYSLDAISRCYSLNTKALKIGFLLTPNIGVWTSGIMKEAIVIPILLLVVSLVVSPPKWWKYVLALVLLYIAFVLKYYFVVPFVIVLFLSIAIRRIGVSIWVVSGCISLCIMGMLLHPNLNIDKFYEAVLSSHNLTLRSSYPVNSVPFPQLGEGWLWMIVYLPKAWYYGVFAPLPWQAYSTLSYLQSIQSVGILLLVVFTLFTIVRKQYKISIQGLLFVGFILFMAGLLPLCSPNIGSLSRYSVIYLPVLISLCLHVCYEKQINPPS